MNAIYTFKISVNKGIYRVLEIRGNKSLDDFAAAILKAFDFDMDHAFGFYDNIKNIYKSSEVYELFFDIPDCEATEGAQSVEHTRLDKVFELKKKMIFLFDYGDDWHFLVKCIKISEPVAKMKYPRVIEKVGASPEQYPSYEDEE